MTFRKLTNQQFERTRTLAISLAGIQLYERHRELLVQRSRRLGINDAVQLDSLLDRAEKRERMATQQLISLVTTKFSGFFRHARQFDVAAEHALRAAHCHGRARLWSAGAANGEEPYSLAISLIEAFGRNDPPISIHATDIDAAGLMTADRGEYSERSLAALEPRRRELFFTRIGSTGRLKITPAVRDLVTFKPLSLADVDWELEGAFDVVFCRNVLMYLEACHRYAVIERLASLLLPGGVLLLDPSEHLGKAGLWFSDGKEGVYLRKNLASPIKGPTRLSAFAIGGS